MATRRIISTEKTIFDQDEQTPGDKSDISPAVSSDVILKMLGFTLAMIVMPIGSFFATVHTIFQGNSTYAGALAAVMANAVLIAYVVVAMREDDGDQKRKSPEEEVKKMK